MMSRQWKANLTNPVLSKSTPKQSCKFSRKGCTILEILAICIHTLIQECNPPVFVSPKIFQRSAHQISKLVASSLKGNPPCSELDIYGLRGNVKKIWRATKFRKFEEVHGEKKNDFPRKCSARRTVVPNWAIISIKWIDVTDKAESQI